MSATNRSRLIAVAGFLVACGIGALTNIVTSNFTWAVAATLGVLVLTGAVLTWMQYAPTLSLGAGVTQTARRRGLISRSPIHLRGDARVRDRATSRGTIEDSSINADRGRIRRKAARDGRITGSDITIQ
jgi:hypothetical protein